MIKLASAIALTASITVTSTASAFVIDMDFEGVFTMVTPTGSILFNPDAAGDIDPFGIRTPISGTLSFDTDTGAGTGTVGSFDFSGTNAAAHDITMQAIGDGVGGPGTLVMGSMLFDYGPTLDIPVYIIADATGLFVDIGNGVAPGDVITGGVASASQSQVASAGFAAFTPDIGNVPFAMTTLDVNQDENGQLIGGGFPSYQNGQIVGGGFPLSDDGIAGVQMATTPFPGHGANFDITSLTVITPPDPVPVPAAVWLFGSGLLVLTGFARRKAHACED